MSPSSANPPRHGPKLANFDGRNVGIIAALSSGHQRDSAGAAHREGRRRRSAVRASAERPVRGVAAGLQSVLPFAVAMEDVPGIVRGLASPDCPRRAVEPG